jgi:hypothetical protein
MFLATASILMIGLPLKYWGGNPYRIILLKLIDHCCKEENPKAESQPVHH